MRTIQRIGKVVAAALVGLMIADLATIWGLQKILSQPVVVPVPPARPKRSPEPPGPDAGAAIIARNIFNSDGLIPKPLASDGEEEFDPSKARPTQLPLTLLATIVLEVPDQSIAAFRVGGVDGPRSFRVGQAIEGLATLVKVERGRVYVRNLATNGLEYVDMPIESTLAVGEPGHMIMGEGITRESETEYRVERGELKRLTDDLPSLLRSALAVPNTGPDGKVNGFRVMSMEPDSIFAKLGIRPMDVIKSVNGQPIDSPSKAIELYNSLRDARSISLGIERDGKLAESNYSIN